MAGEAVGEAVWEALFLRAPAPGAVFRFLERQKTADPVLPETVVLSAPQRPEGYRFLLTTPSSVESLRFWGERLSGAFSDPVGLLFSMGDAWGYAVWSKGVLITEGTEPLIAESPLKRAFSLLPGVRVSSAPYLAWAESQNFPAQKIPALKLGKPLEIVEYRTVSSLDQRQLLVEEPHRCYRFTLK